MTTQLECPYLPACERQFLGAEMSRDEEEGLHAHLDGGCPVCEGRIEAYLSGDLGPGDDAEAAAAQEAVEAAVRAALAAAGETMEAGRAEVLERLERRLAEEERATRRQVRRRHLRVLFYLTNLVAVVLLVTAYVGTRMAIRVQQLGAQELATRTETLALASALARFVQDHGQARLPADLAAALRALGMPRARGGGPYYPLDGRRLDPGGYADDFGRPYRYLRRGDRVLLYSLGRNGRDEEGEGDDLGRWLTFSGQ